MGQSRIRHSILLLGTNATAQHNEKLRGLVSLFRGFLQRVQLGGIAADLDFDALPPAKAVASSLKNPLFG